MPMVGGSPDSSTTKTGRHDIAESGVKHNKSMNKNKVIHASNDAFVIDVAIVAGSLSV